MVSPEPVAFGPAGTDGTIPAYVSNQDTNVVASFTVDLTKHDATPQPVASYLTNLYPQGKFLDRDLRRLGRGRPAGPAP